MQWYLTDANSWLITCDDNAVFTSQVFFTEPSKQLAFGAGTIHEDIKALSEKKAA